jgi:hypothetical protein
MFSLDGGNDIPITSRDIGLESLNSPFGFGMMPMMPMMPYPSLLGGTSIPAPLGEDKFMKVRAEKDAESRNVLRKTGLFFLTLGALAMMPVLYKGMKTAGGPITFIKNIWNAEPKTPGVLKFTERVIAAPFRFAEKCIVAPFKFAGMIGRGFMAGWRNGWRSSL